MSTHVDDHLTRRSLGVAAALAGLAGLTACGDDDAAPETDDGVATRTVEGADGPVEIPPSPQRVVCTDFYTTYALLDVGFTPVGTAEATVGGVLPSQQEAYDAIAKVGATTEIDYEAVVALQPDLVLGTLVPGLAEDLPDRLAQIAPSLLFRAGVPGDWKERAVRAGDAVGRRADAELLAADYDRRVEELRTTYGDALASTTWGLLRAAVGGQVFVDGPASWSGVVLADLGATFSAGAPTTEVTTPLSLEQLGVLDDCDVVLLLANAAGEPDPTTAEVVASPVFSRLPAAQAGRAVPLSSYYAAHYLDGMAVLDQLEDVLAGL